MEICLVFLIFWKLVRKIWNKKLFLSQWHRGLASASHASGRRIGLPPGPHLGQFSFSFFLNLVVLLFCFYSLNFEEVDGAYWFRVVRPSMRASVHQEPCMLKVLKFHIWILHRKIADTHFFSCLSYLPFWSYAPLKKSEWNPMHAISYELCMLGFWNFIYGFLMEK